MRFLSLLPTLTLLMSGVHTAPVVSETSIATKAQVIPAVEKLTSLVSKFLTLVTVIDELPTPDPNVANTVLTLIPTMLSDLSAATQLTQNGPDIDLMTAAGYIAAAIPLTFQVRQLATALKEHKKDLDAMGLTPAISQFANDAYGLMSQFSDAYLARLTAILLLPAKIWLDDFKDQFDQLRQVFGPQQQSYAPQQQSYAPQQQGYIPQQGYAPQPLVTYAPSFSSLTS